MERNSQQIQFYVRKTEKNLIEIVEAYDIGKIKIGFRTYSLGNESGSKVDNKVDFYMPMQEFELLCQNLLSGNIIKKLKNGHEIPVVYKGSVRDGKVFSRTLSISQSKKGIFITATEGDGKKDQRGAVQPLYKLNEAPNRVSIALDSEEVKAFALQGRRALDVFYMRVAMGTQVIGGKGSRQDGGFDYSDPPEAENW